MESFNKRREKTIHGCVKERYEQECLGKGEVPYNQFINQKKEEN